MQSINGHESFDSRFFGGQLLKDDGQDTRCAMLHRRRKQVDVNDSPLSIALQWASAGFIAIVVGTVAIRLGVILLTADSKTMRLRALFRPVSATGAILSKLFGFAPSSPTDVEQKPGDSKPSSLTDRSTRHR